MAYTWQSHHLPKLEVANLDAGDVVVCGAFADRAPMLAELDEERVCFVAPLNSRSDIEWLVRGLHLHPQVRHLVLCGEDHRVVGEALRALWLKGLDEQGEIFGARGRLSPEIEPAAVDALRRDVDLLDWRGVARSGVRQGIRELPDLDSLRTYRALPDPEGFERKVFLSRKTSFPIFSNDVADSWLQLLNLAMRIGTEKQAGDGERLAEVLNVMVTVGLPVIAEDLEVEVAPPEEFPSFFDFNRDDFERYCRRFEAAPESGPEGAHRDYGERLHDWKGIDQLEALCDRLEKFPDTHAGTLVLIEPGDLDDSQAAPHLISATFNASGDELHGSFVLRSADLYTEWPLAAMALVRLQRQVAARVGLDAGAATFVIHSAHLFERDWARASRLLDEFFKRPLPLQVDHSGIFLFGNDGGEARAMLLDHGAGTIFWEDAFSSPIDLSWYIVDAMPWLLPQHVRYVGQECASLMRAMQEGECYLQG